MNTRHFSLALSALVLTAGFQPVRVADYQQYLPKPVRNGLELWVKSDDIKGLKDGDRVFTWPDASGHGHDLRADGDDRPFYATAGPGGFPGVVFKGDLQATPKVNNSFALPLTGDWRGITVFVVGKGLAGAGLIDTAPGGNGCLRTCGWMQLTGTKISLPAGFPNLAKADTPGLATIQCGYEDDGSIKLSTYGNGVLQGQSSDPRPAWGVLFRSGRIGNNNGDQDVFNGEISELLVYRGVLSEKSRLAVERYLMAKYGLSPKQPGDPILPVDYTPPTPPEQIPAPPPVKSIPFTGDLKLWAKADTLAALKDGNFVESWANSMGGDPITSTGGMRPVVLLRGLNNRPTVKFNGNSRTTPKITNAINLPLAGQWPEMTLIVAGRKLSTPGVFDSAPGSNGCLRMVGWMQLCGSKLPFKDPFPLLQKEQGAQVIVVKMSRLGQTGQAVTTYANGHEQMHGEIKDEYLPILFQRGEMGTVNGGEAQFDGDMAEIFIYNRALTDAEIKQTQDYLAEKYAIPIKSDARLAREAAAHSSWTFKLPHLNTGLSWFGNSFSGSKAWVQSAISDLAVLPDGTVAATCVWDEPHKEIGFYKDGKCVGPVVHGGGITIIRSGDYLYSGLSGMGKPRTGFKRLTLDGVEKPWPGFKAGEWPMFDVAGIWQDIKGLAVVGNDLYVTSLGREDVQVFDLETAALKRSFPLSKAGRMAADRTGKLWIGTAEGVAQFDTDGKPTGQKIDGITAGALAFDPQGRLAVADAGVRQQIIFYDVSGLQPREVASLGERGGVWAEPDPGALKPDRIMNPNGLGFDAAGNVYVNGNGLLRSYTPDGKVRWQLECTVFCTCADFDTATDGADIYTGYHHYHYVPGQPPGKDWQWVGYNDEVQKWPAAWGAGQEWELRRLNGQLYRYELDAPVSVQRKDPTSELFIPSALYYGSEYQHVDLPPGTPEKTRFAWSDLNGNGLVDPGEFLLPDPKAPPSLPHFGSFIDSNGGIWEPQDRGGIRYTPLKGFTAKGAPIYDLTAQIVYPCPAPFLDIQRVEYFPETDTLYLSGDTWDYPALGSEWWGQCGREVIRWDNWTKPTRKLRSRMPFPAGVTDIRAISVAPRANLLFAGEMETSVVFVYDTLTGKLKGIVEPDDALFGQVGWIDIDGGIRAFEKKDGEILLLVEDSFAQKEMVYRIPRPTGLEQPEAVD